MKPVKTRIPTAVGWTAVYYLSQDTDVNPSSVSDEQVPRRICIAASYVTRELRVWTRRTRQPRPVCDLVTAHVWQGKYCSVGAAECGFSTSRGLTQRLASSPRYCWSPAFSTTNVRSTRTRPTSRVSSCWYVLALMLMTLLQLLASSMLAD